MLCIFLGDIVFAAAAELPSNKQKASRVVFLSSLCCDTFCALYLASPNTNDTDCAVCAEDYAPGYHHACKSCVGESKQRALAAMGVAGGLVLIAVVLVLAWLVSVVEPSLDAKVSAIQS